MVGTGSSHVTRRPDAGTSQSAAAEFTTTHWSVVLAAGQSSSPASQAALEQLCRRYWYPLYAYVRRRGYSPEDAQDLTQSFFERLLERDLLADLRPAGARFRSFLLHALKNHLASEWTRAHAGKRGGTSAILSLDDLSPEARYAQEAANAESPDAAFERRWASTVLQLWPMLKNVHNAEAELDPVLPRGLCGQCLISLGLASGLHETLAETAAHEPDAVQGRHARSKFGEISLGP